MLIAYGVSTATMSFACLTAIRFMPIGNFLTTNLLFSVSEKIEKEFFFMKIRISYEKKLLWQKFKENKKNIIIEY